jgi:hypothetical protein
VAGQLISVEKLEMDATEVGTDQVIIRELGKSTGLPEST